jgi:hypothetical protein
MNHQSLALALALTCHPRQWNLNPTYGDLRLIWTDGRGGYGGIQPWYTTDGTPADFGLGSKPRPVETYCTEHTYVHC